jgi:hypothetical protein
MAKDLIDFSKFKKIFSDEHKTHLQHPKGHTIIIAHVALKPDAKKQLDALPIHEPEKEVVEHALENAEHMVEHLAHGGKAEKPFHGYNPEKHARTGGLNDSYREKYNREHGSHLKRPVTGHPEAGSEAAGRKKSFCARMKGVHGATSKDGELTPKGAALKRWNCHAHGGKIEDEHDEECMHYAHGGGLYANIHAKRERIAHGSGEHMRKPGKEGAPTAEAFKEAAKTADTHYAHGGMIDLPHFDEKVHYFANAGEVSKDDESNVEPQSEYTETPDPTEFVAREPAKAAPNVIESDEDIEKVKNFVNAMNQREATPMDEEVAAPAKKETTKVPFALQKQEAPAPVVNPSINEKQGIYNNLVDNYVQSLAGSEGGMPSADDYKFGPKGEKPKSFQDSLWDQAEQQYVLNQQAKQASNVELARHNQRLQAAGVAPDITAQANMAIVHGGGTPPPVDQPRGAMQEGEAPEDLGYGAYQEAMTKGIGQQKTGILGKASSEEEMQKEINRITANNLPVTRALRDKTMAAIAQTTKDHDDIVQQIRNAPLHNDYVQSKGVAGRIGIAVGMALAGFGGMGPQALDYIKSQINNDLETQKADLGRKNNLLNTLNNHYQSLAVAVPMATAAQAAYVQEQIKIAAAKIGTQQAWNLANDAIGKLNTDVVAPNIRKAGTYRMMSGLGRAEQMGAGTPDRLRYMVNALNVSDNPEDRQKGEYLAQRLVPNLSVLPGFRPVTEGDISQIGAYHVFDEKARQLMEMLKNKNEFSPAEYQKAQSLYGEVQHFLKDSFGGGGGTAGERHDLETLLPSPNEFFKVARGKPEKLQMLIDNSLARYKELKKNKGIITGPNDIDGGNKKDLPRPSTFRPTR